nr:unnamed protein product [Callosobruchus analis]
MPNSRERHRDRSHSHSEERENLSLLLKRIEHRLGRLEQRPSPPNEHQETSGRLSDELISIFTAESDAKQLFSAPIQPELAAYWTRTLSSGLAVETKENIIKKYLPPENCQELTSNSRLGQLQDIGRLLCDVHYNESVSRKELLCLNLNKDFKKALKDSPIEKWLFGSNLVTKLKTLPEELSTNKTFSASDRNAGQGERQGKSPLVLEVGTPRGRLRYFIQRWKHFSFHKKILSYINGVTIPLCDLPKQTFIPSEPQRSKGQNKVILNLIKELLKDGTSCPASPKENQFISNIFTRPKLDGSNRLILNLKKFNHFVKTSHSKIEEYRTVAHLITPNVFMATIGLKNTYYLVPIKKP